MQQSRCVESLVVAVLVVLAGCGGFAADGVDGGTDSLTGTETGTVAPTRTPIFTGGRGVRYGTTTATL